VQQRPLPSAHKHITGDGQKSLLKGEKITAWLKKLPNSRHIIKLHAYSHFQFTDWNEND